MAVWVHVSCQVTLFWDGHRNREHRTTLFEPILYSKAFSMVCITAEFPKTPSKAIFWVQGFSKEHVHVLTKWTIKLGQLKIMKSVHYCVQTNLLFKSHYRLISLHATNIQIPFKRIEICEKHLYFKNFFCLRSVLLCKMRQTRPSKAIFLVFKMFLCLLSVDSKPVFLQ